MQAWKVLLYACCFSLLARAQGETPPYIPYDVTDAIRELDQILDPAAKEEFQLFSKPVGMAVRNRWNLWNESRLARYFYAKGIYNPELMWGIIAEAFQAKASKKPFVLKDSIRQTLSTYSTMVNLPKGMGNVPGEAQDLHITHYIQRDDLSAIHVFSNAEGKPKLIFVHGDGWSPVDQVILDLLRTPEAIPVFLAPRPPSAETDAKP